MSYKVEFVPDELGLMPQGHDWVIVNHSDDGLVLYIRASARKRADAGMAALIEEAWVGYMRHIEREAEFVARARQDAG